jgi:hypothetical protein
VEIDEVAPEEELCEVEREPEPELPEPDEAVVEELDTLLADEPAVVLRAALTSAGSCPVASWIAIPAELAAKSAAAIPMMRRRIAAVLRLRALSRSAPSARASGRGLRAGVVRAVGGSGRAWLEASVGVICAVRSRSESGMTEASSARVARP